MNIAQIRRAAAAALIAALALAACSSGEPDAPETTDENIESLPEGDAPALGTIGSELSIKGDFGDNPEFTWPDADHPSELNVEVLHEGDGKEVAEGSHVLANYEGYVWQRAEPFDSSFRRGGPIAFPLTGVVRGWSETIPGHKVGSRLLITIPPEYGYGDGGNPNAGIGGTDTIVFVVDIIDTFDTDSLGEADAAPVELPADVPVEVDGELGENSTVEITDGAPEPDKPASYALSEGSGPEVKTGDQVLVSYTLTTWDNSHTESSWDEDLGPNRGPQTLVIGQGTGMDLLAGYTVGSRVLLIHPAAGEVPALVIVADILAAY